MKYLAIAAALCFGIQASLAEEDNTLNAQQLDGLLSGNTVYIAVGQSNSETETRPIAQFKYGLANEAVAKLPNGNILKGTWKIDGPKYCVDWTNGPKNSCSRVTRTDGALVLYNVENGDVRGSIVKVVPGNPENL